MSGGFFKHPKASPSGLVFSTVLAADNAVIDTGANAIPPSGNVLQIYALLKTNEAISSASTVLLRFNGDSGNNYDGNRIQALGTTISAATLSAGAGGFFIASSGASTSASTPSPLTVTVPGYTSSAFFKAGHGFSTDADETAASQLWYARAFEWRSTAAINQVTLAINSGASPKFVAGSGMWVYVQ